MNRLLLTLFSLAVLGTFASPHALAAPYNIGTITYNVSTPPGAAEFDIVNFTGPNSSSFPDPTFPVVTPVSLLGLSLDVSFAHGPDEVFGPSYFTLSPDGLSFNGTALSTGIGQPSGIAGAIGATLTGSFATTSLTLNDGTTITVNPSFSASIFDPTGLVDGDFGVITASSGSGGGVPQTPEPESLILLGTGLTWCAIMRRRIAALASARSIAASVLAALALLTTASLNAQNVRLTAWTSPSAGASGSTFINVNGTGYPSGTINPSAVSISLSTSCGGPVAASATPNSVTHVIGTSDRVQFEIPALLATGTYFISLSGTTTSAASFASVNCSEVSVSHTSSALAACLPSSSLAVLSTPTGVTAYVPNGAWSYGSTGVKVAPIEGPGAPSTIPTASAVNSCSSNSQTGETVCVANNTDVYEITGNTVNLTLTSGSNSLASFSGGSCKNCGVAIDALTNTAVINMGLTGASGDGIQLLNLANNVFNPAFPSAVEVSENVSVDPNRNLILSPNEQNVYDLFKIGPTGALTEYEHTMPYSGGEPDSAAEDCTTGIALSTLEFTGALYIADLSQATFIDPVPPATHGTWSAPEQVVSFPEFSGFDAGTSGISVAAGTTHLGIVTGEFGGATFGVFQLPATGGSGVPSFVDYAAATLPTTPDGYYFSAGFDPHTITAYTSPSNGKAYGLIADWVLGSPSYVAVIDLQALLNAPRTAGTHYVDPSYNLILNNVVRYVPTP